MEEKTFDKEKAPAAGQKSSSSAGHNRRRRRRKKSGAQRAASSQSGQDREKLTAETSAGTADSPAASAEERPAEPPVETPAAERKTPAEQSAPAGEPGSTPADRPEEEATPQAPQAPEPPEEKPEVPQTPEEPEMPESPEEAEPAEPAVPPEETTESAQTPEIHDEETEKTAAGKDGDAPAEEPENPEQQQRAAQMTRTVQLSIEKIVEKIEEEESIPDAAAEGEGDSRADSGEEAEDSSDKSLPARLRRLHRQVGDSMWSLLKWMAFVVAFVAVVAGAGIAWLYKGATPDSIPKVSATFNGEELQVTSYSWHVPVVANVFKRTYADTLSKDPVEIGATIETAQVSLSVRHTDCDTTLTVEDSSGEEVFEGTAEEFGNYTFTKNDTYTAKLVIFRNEKRISHTAEVSGKQTYLFSFTVSLRPSIRLNTVSATQGSVVAVRVSGGVSDQVAPTLSSQLSSTAFHQGENDWVSYLPVAVNQEPGDYTITVSYAGYEQELSLTVKARANVYKDYSSKSKLTSPYIAESDTPAKVLAVLQSAGEEQPAWTDTGFNLPFTDKATVSLAYGTTEYVGRTRSERVAGTGTGRICNNVVVATSRGSDLLAPAAGKVVLAEDLGGTAGYTVVIDHGAGVRSIFYCLRSLSVKAGTTVKRGDVLAETATATIGEVRVGTVPVEPLSVWRGECDALSHY